MTHVALMFQTRPTQPLNHKRAIFSLKLLVKIFSSILCALWHSARRSALYAGMLCVRNVLSELLQCRIRLELYPTFFRLLYRFQKTTTPMKTPLRTRPVPFAIHTPFQVIPANISRQDVRHPSQESFILSHRNVSGTVNLKHHRF
ncbi:hypothetical protein Y032_0991g3320 [Ancylostoma ceylanicum]|uniref:Uncharacterized protein n=1 Tax=Ancylostoma ceylanicum TaxID=53326 RepID=A0A016W9P1_9BILA|nr:hypothetical protein Y032_0991g3320 [Ancylostoma ceylanicum]